MDNNKKECFLEPNSSSDSPEEEILESERINLDKRNKIISKYSSFDVQFTTDYVRIFSTVLYIDIYKYNQEPSPIEIHIPYHCININDFKNIIGFLGLGLASSVTLFKDIYKFNPIFVVDQKPIAKIEYLKLTKGNDEGVLFYELKSPDSEKALKIEVMKLVEIIAEMIQVLNTEYFLNHIIPDFDVDII